MKISFICPTRNNLKYLKWSLASIQKNKGNHEVEFCVWDDFSDDGTYEWLQSLNLYDQTVTVKFDRNNGPTRLGHTILYDKCVKELATNDLCMIWHADMYLCPGALDTIEELMFDGMKSSGFVKNQKRIVSLTRIEPPLHPGGIEKIIGDFGNEPENFDELGLKAHLDVFKQSHAYEWEYICKYDPNHHRKITVPLKGTTNGVFAPWAFWKDEFLEIGGHDSLLAPQSKEDSDVWNRLLMNGTKFLQTREGFVYHFTSRGSRFNPTLTTPGTNSSEWENQNIRSTRNFIRKWGSMVRHDPYLHPIVPHKYNVGFIVKNASTNLLNGLEIWCDHIQVDLEKEIVDRYIEFEQPYTKFDLRSRINSKSLKKVPDILVEIDGFKFTQRDMELISYLSDIITDSGVEQTEMEIGNLRLNIGKMKHYEKELIVCKNE